MKKILTYLFFLSPIFAFGQGMVLKAGDQFPNIPINQIINAPVKRVNLNESKDKKFYILNFWGTWCSPCIPEMDELTKLQKANADRIQVIAISDDDPLKLQKYLKNKPTSIWLSTDTSYLLYTLFNLASVSQCAIVNADKQIVAVMKTHSITQGLLDSLYAGKKIVSNANVKEKPANTSADIFAVDSTLSSNFTVRSYMIGQRSMGKRYGGKSVFAKRRRSFVNTGIISMYKDAYNIVSSNQIIYEVDEKKLDNYEDRSNLYCVDILVKPEEKDSLNVILQQKLNAILPVKARIEYKTIPVYVLMDNGFKQPLSTKETSYGFSGRGYEGEAVTIDDFANDYLSNELSLPVVNETNLKGKFDIKTAIEMRTQANVIKSIEALGLKIEKQERKMRMMVLY
ncbi:redoxin domain-containing protein [Pedobacter sp. UC225_61]|uniref:redoxin domain-containing protein n=1 Tax=Pedobacter sp. UC225_61 TaxID=3374623 RepID=UPI0037B3653F